MTPYRDFQKLEGGTSMILAFKLSNLITVPFGWILGQLYHLTSNYGVAMILFALIVQGVLTPINAKSKKSMMKMSRLQPRIQAIQKKYAGDDVRMNQAMQDLYKDEGITKILTIEAHLDRLVWLYHAVGCVGILWCEVFK